MGTKKPLRVLFVYSGQFSNTNPPLLEAIKQIAPDIEFDSFDVGAEAKKLSFGFVVCLLATLRTYGPSALKTRGRFRFGYHRTKAIFHRYNHLLRKKVDAGNYDVVLQTQSLFSSRNARCPYIVYTDHVARARKEFDPATEMQTDPEWFDLESSIYQNAARVLTFGKSVRNMLLEDYGIPGDRVIVARAGANVPIRQPVNFAVDRYARKQVLFVGIDWFRKGGPELLAAFAKVRARQPDAELLVIGSLPDVPHQDGVRFLGRLSPGALEPYFSNASIFCMPSRVEPFGIVIAEAMQFGLPVVSTHVGEIPDMIEDQKNGYLVAPRDVDALTEALEKLLLDPQKCLEMGRCGWERSKAFRWPSVARIVVSELRRAA